MPNPESDHDFLFDGRLRLAQLPKGQHRAGTDTVLLAAAAPLPAGGPVIDLGCGVGTVGLAVALFDPTAAVTLVDANAESLTLARSNAALNGLATRVNAVEADILGPAQARRAAGLLPNQAALVLTNPPFAEAGRVRASPNDARRQAHVLPDGGLERWVRTGCDLLRPGGALVMI
ncbi:MAG: methyltransferase, partial [Beijerinckiaceae bacterium]